MKICPQCNKTYADDNLNFCLEDGFMLRAAPAGQMDSTIVMEPRPTQPQTQPPPSQYGSPPTSQPGAQQGSQAGWQQQPQQYAMQAPKKSSKTWVWVVAILGILLLLCGGGFAGFIFWAAKQANNANFVVNSNHPTRSTPSNTQNSNKPSATTSPSTSTSTSSRADVTTVDLDMFTKSFTVFATTELTGDELTVGSTMKDYYYALVAPVKDSNGDAVEEYKTDDADSRVTVRNIDNTDSRFGYGLVFHSSPEPLQQGYAFLIDSKKKRYRVVHHEPQKELTVVKWTNSPAINGGTEDNILEARDQSDKIELYINGTMVTSIPNTYGYPGGVIGIYAGDKVKIGFRNLEIRR
jgi:hypothetical protein